MQKIQDEILEAFLTELKGTEGFSEQHVEKLRELFKDGKKPNPTDVVKVFSQPFKDQIS
jgi:hypothetical protein